jgi:hypothetical protein
MQRLKYGTNSTKTSVPLGSSWQLLQKLVTRAAYVVFLTRLVVFEVRATD